MKHFLILLFISISLYSCISQNTDDKINTYNTMSKKFDVSEFNKNQLNGEYQYTLEDGTVIRQIGDSLDGYQEIISKPSLMFDHFVEYYPNCQVKMFGERYKNFFLKGIWNKYDENGVLLETIDYDEPFKFTFEQVLEWIKERKMDVNDSYFKITRYIEDDQPKWAIQSLKRADIIKYVVLDGISGKELEEGEIDFDNN